MKVNDEVYVLELPLSFGGTIRFMNVSLIVDPHHGLTLVDTGLPDQMDLIAAEMAKDGFALDDIKQVIVTHQDSDHIGSLAPIKEKTGAQVIAFADEIPYIEGTLRSVKYPSPERLAQMPEFAEMLSRLTRTTVDQAVTDGETISSAANAKVVFTPGHTLGHMSLYLPNTKTLIAGDAVVSESGVLEGPMAMATPDMPQALESVKKFGDLDVETIVCYHGGLVTNDANGQLKRVAS